jgi:hypothetical protein
VGAKRTYRTVLPLRLAVAAAAVFWGAAFAVLVGAPEVDRAVVVGSAAFSAFFAAFTFVYGRTAITVTRDGIVASSPFRRRLVRFEEILQVVVRDGVGGRVYALVTRRGPVHFTSLFARHRELFELILDRAGLRPRAA